MTKSLAIVGAGPKAAAIVARAAVLRELWPEREHPQIVVYEQVAPGSAWSGEAGYTSGLLQLCSPAEKDIGFPYVETTGLDGDPTRSIAGEIFRRFSWNAFLVETGRFADWVDRGREPPPHAAWAHYIAWVFERAGQACTIAEVTRIARTGHGMWRITSRAGDVDNLLDSDGVVLTGTGDPRRVPERGEIPAQRIFDPADVWAATLGQALKPGAAWWGEAKLHDHPWMAGASGLPPGKRAHIAIIAQKLTAHIENRRSRQAEILTPFLFQPIVEHCLAVPVPDLTAGGRERALARRAFAARLPVSVLERREKGEFSAFYHRVIADSLPFLRGYLLDGELAGAGLIDTDRFDRLLTVENLIWHADSAPIMAAATAEAWVRCWRRRGAGSSPAS